MQGTVLLLDVQIGDDVAQGQRVAILESMKMEHEISTSISGTIEKLFVEVGETVLEGQENDLWYQRKFHRLITKLNPK